MFLAIVDGRLIALESGFVNPLQPLLFINGDTIARHVKPADGKLGLGITAMGSQLVPEGTLRQVFLYAIAVPVGRATVLLALHMSLKGSFTVPKEGLVGILFSTVSEVIGIGHIDL